MTLSPRGLHESPIDPELAAEAWRLGIPCPFYEVHLKGQASNGRAGEIRVQFENADDAAAYAGIVAPGHESLVRDALEAALGAPLVTGEGATNLVYDPREWDGGPVRR